MQKKQKLSTVSTALQASCLQTKTDSYTDFITALSKTAWCENKEAVCGQLLYLLTPQTGSVQCPQPKSADSFSALSRTACHQNKEAVCGQIRVQKHDILNLSFTVKCWYMS